MCTSDLCNAQDYNFHTERANRLFGKPPQSEAIKSPFFPPTGKRSNDISTAETSRDSQITIVTPSSNLVEDNEVLEDNIDIELLEDNNEILEDSIGLLEDNNELLEEVIDNEASEDLDVVKVHDR